jgi:SAM-dependent MidA family methyltransferase
VHTGNPVLIDFIRRAIRQTGPVTFEWFMEQALYHPELGYYSSGRCALGRRGDYFTNVSVGPLFGRLLAAQFAEMWQRLGRPDDFVIVEQGAHHGDFARDVLGAVRERTPDFFATLRYWIIEPFPILRERQREALRVFSEKLGWEKSLIDLEPFCGVHFSNELLDSMPVRLISRVDPDAARSAAATADWEERCVVEYGDGFGFVTRPIRDADLGRRLETIPLHSNEPYETEVNLAALKWIEKVAQKLTRGYVLTVDYGYARDDLYAPERSSGTLQCRAQHRLVSSPFTGIGETDITAHVDWTSLAERAEANGLSVAAFADQHHFLTGIVTALMAEQFNVNAKAGTRRTLQTLLHPEFLGTTFQFLVLTRNVAPGFRLSGFQFARDPRVALGL